ncbi:MAG: hypothetical protein KJ626_02255 [Verrucomicrobia bacterium]|nr:hypothetical protein [Verrucomicrobiota bacterium]
MAGVLIAVILVSSGTIASGQAGAITSPLHVGALQPISDEFGATLEGKWSQPGDLVQVLNAAAGIAYPPNEDGTPNSANGVITETAIGKLTPQVENPGIFGLSISGEARPESGRIFVRVFNSDKLETASFYADSQMFDIDGNKEFVVDVDVTDLPFRLGDPDHDGLIDSWEMSYGSDPDNPDSDGDGMIDGDEFRARTGINDPDSLLRIARILTAGGTDAVVAWDSVSGVVYQVEFTTNNLPDAHSTYKDFGSPIVASGSEAELLIPDGLLDPNRKYRVRVIE